MKTYKLIDLWGNVVILLAIVFYALKTKQIDTLFSLYFYLGAWQLISAIAHLFTQSFYHSNQLRVLYNKALLITIIIIAISFGLAFIDDLTFFILIVVGGLTLVATFIMAIFYFIICYKEVYVLSKRPLSVIKN
jgi:hypothetical protein